MALPEILFLDLDDTLYPSDSGVWPAISERINRYLIENLHIGAGQAEQLRRHYFRSFGTTLAGLMADHDIQPADYLTFVHDVPIEALIQPDPALTAALESLPQPKWIFTNASRQHAARVLAALGLTDAMQGIIAIEDLQYRNKPDLVAYRRAMTLAQAAEAAGCLLVDDRWQNLVPARRLGMRTVWVGPRAADHEGVDHWIQHVGQLPRILDDLGHANGRLDAGRD
ncbi:MAG TPA: pyrimidine 5'-nucleotidase [Anaerolineales bacterium]|jgi:putative hydrolase of the HAD superfamily